MKSTARLPLDALRFDNRFTSELPADDDPTNARRQVHGACFSRVEPTPVTAPKTLACSAEVAAHLGLTAEVMASRDFADVFAGNRVPHGADPFAACYGGHQFGSWAGQLGDGRAIALGEVIDRDGRRQTLQLKGAGPTPYSRHADGRAVLRSSIREFLCSEAMHHLGIPTTRALSLVATGDEVVRDILYDGHPAPEPGAVVCRVAPSFVRFGNFELLAARNDSATLKALVDFTIRHDFPQLRDDHPDSLDDRLAAFFREVCERTATLVVGWMRVGFVHGVLNTDNMSILGLTIDYGPYGWLEDFDPGWTPNTTDRTMRRYRYGAQPQIAYWNLAQLGSALALLLPDAAPLQEILDSYPNFYQQTYLTMMARRLGWQGLRDSDSLLINELLAALRVAEIDQVIFFRSLADVPLTAEPLADDQLLAPLADAWYDPSAITGSARETLIGWVRRWRERTVTDRLAPDARLRQMRALNPRFVLRNYLAQQAIEAATAGDVAPVHELLEVLRHPYEDQPERARFAARRPAWARHQVGSSMLSCSS